MAYVLRGAIARAGVLRPAAPGFVAELGAGLGLLPITDEFYDDVRQDGAPADPRLVDGHLLPPGFGDTLAEWSKTGPVAYVEAEYFGGTGSQFAVVWADGDLVLGPLRKLNGEPAPNPGMSPISQALRRLGVSAAGHYDEFDAAGLGRHRRISGWHA
jgi:hypothetical protein